VETREIHEVVIYMKIMYMQYKLCECMCDLRKRISQKRMLIMFKT